MTVSSLVFVACIVCIARFITIQEGAILLYSKDGLFHFTFILRSVIL